MAVMHPSFLPDDVRWDYGAEARVYDALSNLPDEFDVFYDAWVTRKRAGSAFENKIDFVIIHEKLGFLAVEIKGGRGPSGLGDGIRLTSNGYRIEQYWPSNKKYNLIDPYNQVREAVRKLTEALKTSGMRDQFPTDCCVIFPDTPLNNIRHMQKAWVDMTLCAESMANLPELIIGMFPKEQKKSAWSKPVYLEMKDRLHHVPKELQKRPKKWWNIKDKGKNNSAYGAGARLGHPQSIVATETKINISVKKIQAEEQCDPTHEIRANARLAEAVARGIQLKTFDDEVENTGTNRAGRSVLPSTRLGWVMAAVGAVIIFAFYYYLYLKIAGLHFIP